MAKFFLLISVTFYLISLSTQSVNKTNSTDSKSRNFQGVDSSYFLNPDEQCKIMLGKEATFCRTFKDQMCKSIFCRKSIKEPCIEFSEGAKDGTTCESGKVCLQKACVDNQQAQVGECLFGDDLVTQEAIGMKLPLTQMDCKDVLNHINKIGQSSTAYCSNSNFRSICCDTCKKYDILSCTDRYFDCPRYKNVCDSATINGLPVTILCPRTCAKCEAAPVKCPENPNICRNGGKCVNIQVSNDTLFGFKCECPLGYQGDLCETRDSCVPNPCNPNEKCVPLGNIAYKCHPGNTSQVSSSSTSRTSTSVSSTSTTRSTTKSSRVSETLTTDGKTTTKLKSKLNTPSILPQECENFNDDICNYYAQQNLCSDEYFLNGKPITKKCKKACKICV